MDCWKCRKKVSEEPIKVGFRAECPHCSISLHSCKGCRYYMPGKPNDCLIPGTDPIKDREKMNFCEDFAPKLLFDKETDVEAAKKKARRLLGLEDDS
ncbi:MAG: hypothetical protein KGJ02_05725 [Verrucomicrobiota bacterium]|nr:hypothetical protein [Verrucomicrobiota bacterium]